MYRWLKHSELNVKGRRAALLASISLLSFSAIPANAVSVAPVSLGVGVVNQSAKHQGTVLDAKTGEPIIGASVVIKGTTNGSITDIDGKFSLDLKKGDVLQISFVGYQTKEITFNGNTQSLNIRLSEDTKMIDEVVVVGYGTQKKVNLSGSVASVSSEQIQNRPIQNLSNGLQGLMPGVTISGTNGAPGMDNGKIRVRGVGTLNEASPYILIDGVESATMNALDPNDIESISVLKDASSAAIYGSKAANGVILITTKRGKSEKARVSYNGYVSVQNATRLIDRLSSYDYARMYNDALKDSGKAPRFTDSDLDKFKSGNDPLYPNTDWYDLAYKTGIMHRHNVSVSGGSDAVKYAGSLGYLNQTGVLPNAAREQFNVRTNLDMKLSDRFNARLNLAYVKNNYSDPSSDYYGGSSDQILRQLNLIAPWIVARYPDGTWGTISDGSPIAWLDSGMKVDRDNHNFTGSAAVDYKIMDGLTLTLSGSYVNNLQNYSFFQKYFRYNSSKETSPNKLDERYYTWNRTNYDALLNYDKTFGKHGVKVLAGWHTEKYNSKELRAERQSFPNNQLIDMNAGSAATQKNSGFSRELAMLSWFGRINYDFAGKYLFEANLRADASSRFAKGHRWGYFPSFSAAWRLSEEAFMEPTRSWLDNLKLRASWGLLGNQDALDDYYPAITTYDISATYPFDGVLNSGYYQKATKLNTISWEKAQTYGVGIDFGLFGNRLSGSIDYYNRKTTGILMKVSVPKEFALDPYVDNVGAMRNSGVELTLNYQDRKGDWTYGASVNFAYNKNEVLDLGGVDYMDNPDNGKQRRAVGKEMDAYFMYKADGLFLTQEEADAFTAKYGNPFKYPFKAGDIRYVDVNGDGKLTGADRTYFDSSQPAFTFGGSLNAGYKNFDLSVMFNGVAKAVRYYDGYEVYGNFSGDAAHPSSIWKDSWTYNKENPKMPRIFEDKNSSSSTRTVTSSYWLQDVSFLRIKNIQLGYTLPKSVLATLGISNLRVYYSVENLLTIDGMKINIDPESTSERMSSYPLLRTHSFGLNLTF